ncbi:MAG: carboxypeptidase regulatory-like domain-containing protein [Clostridia bacterium]|nr:carboxypeptidase regulatory-like domain-containing protein [Clostridia bacterium]
MKRVRNFILLICSLCVVLFSGVILSACKDPETGLPSSYTGIFQTADRHYAITEDYTMTKSDYRAMKGEQNVISVKNPCTFDLGGKALDLNGYSLEIRTEEQCNITFENGIIKGGTLIVDVPNGDIDFTSVEFGEDLEVQLSAAPSTIRMVSVVSRGTLHLIGTSRVIASSCSFSVLKVGGQVSVSLGANCVAERIETLAGASSAAVTVEEEATVEQVKISSCVSLSVFGKANSVEVEETEEAQGSSVEVGENAEVESVSIATPVSLTIAGKVNAVNVKESQVNATVKMRIVIRVTATVTKLDVGQVSQIEVAGEVGEMNVGSPSEKGEETCEVDIAQEARVQKIVVRVVIVIKVKGFVHDFTVEDTAGGSDVVIEESANVNAVSIHAPVYTHVYGTVSSVSVGANVQQGNTGDFIVYPTANIVQIYITGTVNVVLGGFVQAVEVSPSASQGTIAPSVTVGQDAIVYNIVIEAVIEIVVLGEVESFIVNEAASGSQVSFGEGSSVSSFIANVIEIELTIDVSVTVGAIVMGDACEIEIPELYIEFVIIVEEGELDDYVQHTRHIYIVKERTESTCTQAGHILYACACGESYTESLPLKAHRYESVERVEPTCVQRGYEVFRCRDCADSYRTDYATVAHGYVEKERVTATCQHGGYVLFECSVCKNTERRNEVPATDHNFVSYDHRDATCEEDGYDKSRCSFCSLEDSRVIDKLGHDYLVGVTVFPTESEAGKASVSCNRCEDVRDVTLPVLSADNYTIEEWTEASCTQDGVFRGYCTIEGQRINIENVVEKLGHDYSETIQNASCVSEGYVLHTCSRCQDSYRTDVTPQTGHNFSGGVCTDCGLHIATKVTGRVYEADADANDTNNPRLSDVAIVLNGQDEQGNSVSESATTNASGEYTFENIPYGTYTLTLSKDSYITNNCSITVNMLNQQNANIYLVSEASLLPGYIAGTAKDATTGSGISGITVYVRSGSNNTTGDVVCTATTGSGGSYRTDGIQAGNYTLQFVDNRSGISDAQRYGSSSINVAVIANQTVSNRDITLSNSAAMNANSLRIVLTWGASPSDLDSHLEFGSTHISYSNKTQNNARLDVDDTSAYGPETITISTIASNTTYRYYVHNYSGGGNSVLSNSGATVTVYLGNSSTPYYTFYVPSGSGRTWNVFSYNSTTGFTVTNSIS